MFFVSLNRPTKAQEQGVCSKGLRYSQQQQATHYKHHKLPILTVYTQLCRLGFNFNSPGGSLDAPPLSAAAQEDGWWNIDHERIKVCCVHWLCDRLHCC